MTDNSVIPVSVGTETFANKDVAGVKYPRTVTVWGGAGVVNDADIATGKPLPIQLRGSDGTDRSNLLPVSLASLPALAAGSATVGKVDQGLTGASAWKVDGSAVTQPVSNAVQLPAALGAHGAMKIEGVASGTLVPVTIDPTQLGSLVVSSVPVITGGNLYVDIPNDNTGHYLTTTGSDIPASAVGTSYLEHIICNVTDPTNCAVVVVDGAGSSFIALGPTIDSGLGTQQIAFGILNKNTGVFRVSCATGVTARATGRWS